MVMLQEAKERSRRGRFCRRLGQFAKRTDGNVAILAGVSMVALVSAVGVAVDGTRILLARSEFQKAVDSAALAIGTTYQSEAQLQVMAERFVAENFFMGGTTVSSIDVVSTPDDVAITALMEVDLYFARLFSDATPVVSVSTEVQRAGGGLMVSLVLDNTGSMWGSLNGTTRIEALRAASLRLTDVLFDENEVDENLRVSVVPYAAVVNPGDEAENIVDNTGTREDGTVVAARPGVVGEREPDSPDYYNEIRENVETIFDGDFGPFSVFWSNDRYDFSSDPLYLNDLSPRYLDHFRPMNGSPVTAHRVRDEDGDLERHANGDPKLRVVPIERRMWLRYDPADVAQWKGCVFERPGANSLADTPPTTQRWEPFVWPIAQDNQYGLKLWNGYADTNEFTKYHTEFYVPDPLTIEPGGNEASNHFYGPNTGCPTPILPLTKTKQVIQDSLNAMTAWNRGGTLGDVGMAWGYRTLTPGAPFTQSDTEIDPVTSQKIWDSTRWRRAVVMMTDGDNVVYDAGNEGTWVKRGDEDSDLTAYGRLGDDRFKETLDTDYKNAAKNMVDARLANLCTKMKNDNIVIYTIVFSTSASSATRSLYEDCATDPGKFFYAPSASALDNAFGTIGADLNKLRIKR